MEQNNRIIFFTNTPSEYRIPLHQELSARYPITFVYTRIDVAEKIYNTKLDPDKMAKIRYRKISSGKQAYRDIESIISEEGVEGVVIPPLDTYTESLYGYCVFRCAKKFQKKTFYYWEKWEAPKSKQPLKKKVKNSLQRVVSKHIFTHVDYCLGMGNKACEYFVNNGVKKHNCCVTFNTSMSPIVSLTDWRVKNNIPEDRKVVMYFGRVIEKKGLRYLIQAYAALPEEEKNKSWLVVAGDGPDREALFKLATDLDIKNMSWLGFIHPDNRYDYFKQCDIFVLPTFHYKGSVEGWGLTINEAIQCGKIVIATTAVGSAYDLINEKNGFIVEPESPDSLKDALVEAIDGNNKLDPINEDEKLMSIYNYQNSANRFIEVFNKVLEK